MTNTQKKILSVFKEFKVPKDGVLKPQSINIRSWDRRSQDEFNDSINGLIAEDYISTKEGWYVLTETGYNYIYRDYSIEDTKDLIMDVFRKHRIGVGDILMQNSLLSLLNSVDRYHFDNYNLALQSLITEDFIANGQRVL